jgi:hypothetical protein
MKGWNNLKLIFKTLKIIFMVIKVKYFAGGKVMTTVTRSQNQSDIVIL